MGTKQIIGKIYVSPEPGEPFYYFSTSGLGGWPIVADYTIEFEEPAPESIVLQQVKAQEKFLEEVNKEWAEKVAVIERNISKLLSLSYSGPVVTTEADDDIPF